MNVFAHGTKVFSTADHSIIGTVQLEPAPDLDTTAPTAGTLLNPADDKIPVVWHLEDGDFQWWEHPAELEPASAISA